MALVNFSIPIIPSFTKTEPDKGIPVRLSSGEITNQILFIPDIKVLTKFAEGNIGIANNMRRKTLTKSFDKIDNVEQLDIFTKASGAKLKQPSENYFKDGKFQIDLSEVELTESPNNLGGIGSIEQSIIQSIFETQKPYMEIVKLVTENFVKIEDIIARVLAISGSSLKPKKNPKALGYEDNTELSSSLFKLDALSKIKTEPKENNRIKTPDYNTNAFVNGVSYMTQSIVYSTGEFNPNIEYTYIYIDVKDNTINLPNGTSSIAIGDDNDLPKYVIFGVFDSEWNVLDSSLIDITTQQARIDGTIQKNINWVKRSGKWYGQFDQILEDVDFQYVKNGGDIVYYRNDGPSLDVEGETRYIKKGFPKVKSINELSRFYSSYYLDETQIKLNRKGFSQSTSQTILNEVSNRLNTPDKFGTNGIQTTIEGALKNGFLPFTNASNTPGLTSDFNKSKYPFKPKKVTVNANQFWIDPESKYDMKIIKCDSSTDITYLDIEKDNKQYKKTQILRFIKKTLSFSLSDQSNFSYVLTGNTGGIIPNRSDNVIELILDNHNSASSYTLVARTRTVSQTYRNGSVIPLSKLGKNSGYYYRFSNNGGNYRISFGNYVNNNFNPISLTSDTHKSFSKIENNKFSVRFPNNQLLFFDLTGGYLYTEIFNGSLNSYLPNNTQKSTVIVNVNDSSISSGITTLPANSLRVKDDRFKFGKLISNTQILNERLASNIPFSKGLYGTPINKNQSIEQIYRYMQTEDDTETYYIVEGILSSNNIQKIGDGNTTNSNIYTFPDLIGAITSFIDIIIDIFSKLVPSITQFISTIKDPSKLITDIIISKLGDNFGTEPERFGFFSSGFLNDLKNLANIKDKNEKDNFIKNSKLSNYVYVDEENNNKFLLDGAGTVKLFGDAPILAGLPGIKFGIETNIGSLSTLEPKVPFKFIIERDVLNNDKTINELTTNSKDRIKNSPLYNTNYDTNNITGSEDISIEYSTGVFRTDVDYTYIYVTEYIKGILDEVEELQNTREYRNAINKLEEASKIDPKNKFIKDKIDEIKKLLGGSGIQPIIEFILNIVSLPLKVIFGIISYIIDFFKSLLNPFELPGKIIEFLSFKWLLDFFDPTSDNSILSMANLKFDIQKFTSWITDIDLDSFDLNEIIKIPWIQNLPTYTKEQFDAITSSGGGQPRKIPIQILNSILCLFESIVNGFIDFIWSLIGLGSLIPIPHIKLCKDTNDDLNTNEIMSILNGDYKDSGVTNSNYNFIYNIKTSDGRDIRELNRVELEKWIEENKNLQFIFNT